jgi:hypothetical protein
MTLGEREEGARPTITIVSDTAGGTEPALTTVVEKS